MLAVGTVMSRRQFSRVTRASRAVASGGKGLREYWESVQISHPSSAGLLKTAVWFSQQR